MWRSLQHDGVVSPFLFFSQSNFSPSCCCPTDFKFETDPYDVKLHGLMTPEQYTEAIENLNNKLRPSRSGKADGVLLAAGPLIVPLAIWGVRHRNQTRRRKRLLKDGIHEFNMQYQELLMRWNRRPDSFLTIERRHGHGHGEAVAASNDGMDDQETAVAHATLISDVVAPATMTPSMSQQPRQPSATQRPMVPSSSDPSSSSGLV